ncbi:hypothetical protein H072_1588 [Dactylellina haptotyla CBS 200.50]|uniref:SnoaL-like domain-containing protein n=1 Tax=Dactylellina haptotyla (strain CBS 200.50) TaxID=1284197 RepID=S8ATV7_DACHA|nr:hypothetical protein H072_1588 [Dactylellina haptotyla CBS 200.50]
MASVEQVTSLTKDNLHIIFGSHSHEERMKNLQRLWHPDAIFIDPAATVNTHQATSDSVAKLLNPGWEFQELGPVDVISPPGSDLSVARLRWGYGKAGEAPEVTGLDVVTVKDGKIERLYTFLDAKP